MNHPKPEISESELVGGWRAGGGQALVTTTPDLRCNLEKQESAAPPAIKDAENKDVKCFVSKLKEKPKSRREIGWKGRLTGQRVFCTDLPLPQGYDLCLGGEKSVRCDCVAMLGHIWGGRRKDPRPGAWGYIGPD